MSDESERVRELAERYWDDLLALDPILATEVGDERFDHLLPDRSPDGLARRQEVHQGALEEVGRIERTALDREDRIALDLVEAMSNKELAAIEHRFDRLDAADHMSGPGSMLVQIASLQLANTPERLDRYVARLEALPDFLAASSDVLREAGRAGQTQPRLVVERSIAQVERLLGTPPGGSPTVGPVPEADTEGRARVAETVRDRVYPAYQSYLEELRAHRTLARTSLGLGALPGGEAMYAAKIRGWTSLSLGPREIHQRGADELAGLQAERGRLAEAVGAPDPETAIERHSQHGRNRFASRPEIVRLAEEQVERGWEAAHRFFGRLPSANCKVQAVDPSWEDDVLEHYLAPTADGTRPGTYYVNTKDPERRHRHSLATITYHEANPGHHLQIAIEQEAPGRLAIRRFAGADHIALASSFIEGWGLYAERLADEMGLYRDDYERMGMLEMQAFRAARLVVDTGIHAFGWDRQRAIDTMASTGTERSRCEVEVDRYVAWPGQALCYTLGRLAIDDIRAEASKAGQVFSLPDFHDRLLSLGSVPLSTLQREMRAFDS